MGIRFRFGTPSNMKLHFSVFGLGPGISLRAPGPERAKNLFRPVGVRPKKRFPGKLRETIPDSAVTFFSISGPLLLWGPERLACCCLLDAQAPPWCPKYLINRLKYYVLQLGDPNPHHCWTCAEGVCARHPSGVPACGACIGRAPMDPYAVPHLAALG